MFTVIPGRRADGMNLAAAEKFDNGTLFTVGAVCDRA